MEQEYRSYFEDLVTLSKENGTFNKRTVQALTWFKNKIKQTFGDKSIDPQMFFEKKNYPNVPIPGNIVTFRYTPREPAKLPYYDVFPLVLIIKLVPGGFIGLNFHHLHPMDRAGFMGKLEKYQKTFSNNTIRINIRYETLKRSLQLVYYKPCIRRYYISSIKTMFYTLTPNEWDVALFLPTEKFVRVRKQKIWEQSQKTLAQLREKSGNDKRK